MLEKLISLIFCSEIPHDELIHVVYLFCSHLLLFSKKNWKNCHESAIADHVFLTNHSIKWDHFEILATGRSEMHCKIKEPLLIRYLKPALNENVGNEKLHLYY